MILRKCRLQIVVSAVTKNTPSHELAPSLPLLSLKRPVFWESQIASYVHSICRDGFISQIKSLLDRRREEEGRKRISYFETGCRFVRLGENPLAAELFLA